VFDFTPRSSANAKVVRFIGASFKHDPGVGPFVERIECRRNRLIVEVRLEPGVFPALIAFCERGRDQDQLRFDFGSVVPS
jgi:hypothetical protein